MVRMISAVGLSKLMAYRFLFLSFFYFFYSFFFLSVFRFLFTKTKYSKRVDPVVVDLLKTVEETCSSQFSSDEDLEIAEAILKALQGLLHKPKIYFLIPHQFICCLKIGVFMKGGSAMNHDALVKAGLRLRSVLLHLENNANPKPQIFVLIGSSSFFL